MHHNWLGLVLEKQGIWRPRKKSPQDARVGRRSHRAMANSDRFICRRQPEEAVAILRQALLKDARNPESRTNLIVALGMTHDLDGARRRSRTRRPWASARRCITTALAYALARQWTEPGGPGDGARVAPDRSPPADALRLPIEIEDRGAADGSPTVDDRATVGTLRDKAAGDRGHRTFRGRRVSARHPAFHYYELPDPGRRVELRCTACPRGHHCAVRFPHGVSRKEMFPD